MASSAAGLGHSVPFCRSSSATSGTNAGLEFNDILEDLGDLRICPCEELMEEWHQIELDVPRSGCSSTQQLEVLLKVYAYRRLMTETGSPYTQGMNMIAVIALDLAGVDASTEVAFHLYRGMTDDILGYEFFSAFYDVHEPDGEKLGAVELPLLNCYVASEGLQTLVLEEMGFNHDRTAADVLDLKDGIRMMAFRWFPAGLANDMPWSLTCAAWRWALQVAAASAMGKTQMIPLILVALEFLLPYIRDTFVSGADLYQSLTSQDTKPPVASEDILQRAQARFDNGGDSHSWAQVWHSWAEPVREDHIEKCVAAFHFRRLKQETRLSVRELEKLQAAFEDNRLSPKHSNSKRRLRRKNTEPKFHKFHNQVTFFEFAAVCEDFGLQQTTISRLWHAIVGSHTKVGDLSEISLGRVAIGLSNFLRGSFKERLRFCFNAFASDDGVLDAVCLDALNESLKAAAESAVSHASRRASEVRNCNSMPARLPLVASTQIQEPLLHHASAHSSRDDDAHINRFIGSLREVCSKNGSVTFEDWQSLVLADLTLCGMLVLTLGGDEAAGITRERSRKISGRSRTASIRTIEPARHRCKCLRNCMVL